MYESYRNSGIYNIIAEGEIANYLAQYNENYVYDVINQNIANRFAYNTTVSNPNIVNSFEMNFRAMATQFPTDVENVQSVRQETYEKIVNTICTAFNLQYVGDNPDIYTVAYHLYDVFVSGFARNVITFFSNYIYHNAEVLYNNLALDRYKKSRDSTTVYVKTLYDNKANMMGVILAHIKDVLYYVSGFDISLSDFLGSCYPAALRDFIISNIAPLGNIYKDEFCKVVENPAIMSEIKSNMFVMLQQELGNQQQQPVEETEEETETEE